MSSIRMLSISALCAGLFSIGCPSSETGHVEVSLSSNVVRVPLPDPRPDFPVAIQSLFIKVTQIDIHTVSAQDPIREPDRDPNNDIADDEGEWSTLFSGESRFDLLALGGLEEFLGDLDVLPGQVTQLRLVISGASAAFTDGTAEEVACPSCENTGIKIVPQGTLEIPAGGSLQLLLLFDVERSLGESNGSLRLKPVIHLSTLE